MNWSGVHGLFGLRSRPNGDPQQFVLWKNQILLCNMSEASAFAVFMA
jgi:hypothetical protein